MRRSSAGREEHRRFCDSGTRACFEPRQYSGAGGARGRLIRAFSGGRPDSAGHARARGTEFTCLLPSPQQAGVIGVYPDDPELVRRARLRRRCQAIGRAHPGRSRSRRAAHGACIGGCPAMPRACAASVHRALCHCRCRDAAPHAGGRSDRRSHTSPPRLDHGGFHSFRVRMA